MSPDGEAEADSPTAAEEALGAAEEVDGGEEFDVYVPDLGAQEEDQIVKRRAARERRLSASSPEESLSSCSSS